MEEERWEKLLDFLNENKIYVEDMLACVSVALKRNCVREYKNKIKIGDIEYLIRIKRDD